MPIANYSTTIAVEKTMMEVQQILAKAGAKSIRIDYDGPEPSALYFALEIAGQIVGFRLPAKPDGVLRTLKRDGVPRTKQTLEQAKKVAWRLVKDWLRAQLALVDAEQATLAEVMLPYAVTASGLTIYDEMVARGPGRLLEAGA